MKTNFKILDQTDPEFINTKLDESAIHEISKQLKKRRHQSTTPVKSSLVDPLMDRKVKN